VLRQAIEEAWVVWGLDASLVALLLAAFLACSVLSLPLLVLVGVGMAQPHTRARWGARGAG
jgi:hypothetical protein